MVLSVKEHAFLVKRVFQESNRYTDLVQQQFAEKFPETFVPRRNAVHEITSWFQQDGTTAHAANNSMKLLNKIFGERVISTNLWPPSLTGSYSTRLYLWGAAKSAVYHDHPHTLNDLKTAISQQQHIYSGNFNTDNQLHNHRAAAYDSLSAQRLSERTVFCMNCRIQSD
jgi:hypothetical protein